MFSLVFSDIYVSKMEEDTIAPMKPHFFKRYIDDTYIWRKNNEPDSRFEKLNCCHPNTKLTIEKNPAKFLDIEIIQRGCEIETKLYNKWKKVIVHWTSGYFTRYKHNAITGELYWAKRVANDFNFVKSKKHSKSVFICWFPYKFYHEYYWIF